MQNRELVIENGQIIDRRMSESGDGGQEEAQVKLEDGEQMGDENMDDETYGEDGMMTLDSAVQEAVSQAAADQADKQGEQLVAQIVHADPPSGSKFFSPFLYFHYIFLLINFTAKTNFGNFLKL